MKLYLFILIYIFILSISYGANLDENHPGYKVLQSKYFDKFGEGNAAELTKLHKVWPPNWTNKILKDQSNLKELYWQRYGFVPAPYDNDGLPTGFPKMGSKSSLNCLYCLLSLSLFSGDSFFHSMCLFCNISLAAGGSFKYFL